MSNITLAFNGQTAPTTYRVGSTTLLQILVDGAKPLTAEWDYGLRSGPRVASGVTTEFFFVPLHLEPYYIHVTATSATGVSVEAIFPVIVTPTGASSLTVSINWADPQPIKAGLNSATIAVSGVIPPQSVAWSHYYNGVQFEQGSGFVIPTRLLGPGVHHIVATVLDPAGFTVVGESTLRVPGGFGLQAAVVPPQPVNSSLIYLGSVYSPILAGHPVVATTLPFPVASFESSVKLIPGSTHFVAELDPVYNTVDDEVVVRTQLGNWTLKGPPSGLTAENLPYDYQHGQPFQPAPLDLSAHYAVDVWNAHNMQVSAFNFRVRFRCFIQGDAIYRYTPCAWSSYSGGTGERQRRLIALPTKLDLSLDDETPQNRGNSTQVETFTIPNQGFIIGNMETSGLPDRPRNDEDHFYTDQNTIAIYESDNGLEDVLAKCTYGMPDVRPCVVDFSSPALPRIVNKPKRLWDKLVLYMAGGAFNAGTVVTVRVYTGAAPGFVDVPITLNTNVYNPGYAGFVKAGEALLDITDFEFDRLGVKMTFQIDESHAGTVAPPYDQMMSVGEDFYYTRLNSPAIRIDTACFHDPTLMATFDGTFLGSAVPLASCNTLVCGPLGTYCYVEVGGTGTYSALQPLGFPAPFIAPYGDEAHCYGNPTFMAEYFGGYTQADPDVMGYSGTNGCGQAYQYIPCDTNMPTQLGVVFPKNTSPHPAVNYGGDCFTLLGAIKSQGQLTWLTAADVSPVTGCTDITCTGSNPNGGSIDYIDQETLEVVTVAFPHPELGKAYWAGAPEARSQGYGATPPGSVKWSLWDNPVVPLFTAAEYTNLDFTVTPTNIWREIVVTHAGQRQHYRFYPGLAKASITVQAADVVTLEFGNRLRQYRGISGEVSWVKPVPVPYLYDTGTVTFSPATGTLVALGFCGLDARQDYSFYGTLDGSRTVMDFPNPDCVVTVKDNSALPEMVVVRTKQPHEVDFQFDLPSYQAQLLRSPLIFKFYAGRNRTGAHGEMDVWLHRTGSPFNPPYPSYFKVSPFKSLVLSDSAFPKTTVQTDTTRRALRVTDQMTAMDLISPRIHVDDRGHRVSVMTDELNDYVFFPGNPNPYTFTDVHDTGISETVYWDLVGGGGPQLFALYSVPGRPRGICYVSSQDEIWCACPDSNMVVILAGDGTGIKQLLTVPNNPCGIDYSPVDDRVVIFTYGDGFANLYDAPTRAPLANLDTGLGPFYPFIYPLAAYNPTSQNIYIAGVPYSNFDMHCVEVDPTNGNVRDFPLLTGAVSLANVFYCPTTLETIIATESGGSFAFNVYTDTVENLGIPTSTCRGACAAPEIGRIFFTNAANPPGDRHFLYDPRSRRVTKTWGYTNPARATGWHPKRRKFYVSALSIYFGGPGVGVINVNGVQLSILQNFDWGFQWAYSPISRLMFNSIPASFFGSNYVGVYT